MADKSLCRQKRANPQQRLCNFFYFTDVYPGDGGLVVLPDSHKASFERPEGIFFPDIENPPDELHPALVNVTARAGDVIVMSELLTHGVLIWQSKERY